MLFAEDEHSVGDLGPGGEHEPFRVSVRVRTPRRNLDRFDTGIGQDRVERGVELPGPVPDQEPEVGGATRPGDRHRIGERWRERAGQLAAIALVLAGAYLIADQLAQ